jgi:hypothetical protein
MKALFSLFVLVLLATACRRASESPADSAAAPPPGGTIESTAPVPAAGEEAFAFTEADLDAYERGLKKETELVLAAQKRGEAATTPEERGKAAQGEWEDQTAPEAARLIGVSPERYRQVRKTVNRVLETLDFQGKIDGPMEMNMDLASPEMKARLTSDPFSELAPASAAALKARMDRIVPVWVEYAKLTAVHG